MTLTIFRVLIVSCVDVVFSRCFVVCVWYIGASVEICVNSYTRCGHRLMYSGGLLGRANAPRKDHDPRKSV
jgi:hypothetical protein